MNIRSILYTVFFLLLTSSSFLLSNALPAKAQGVELTISPPLSVKNAQEGNVIRYPLKITNSQDREIKVLPHIYRFHSNGQNGTPVIDFGSSVPYARIETNGFAFEAPFSLAKGQTQDIVIAVTPPSPLREDLNMIFLLETAQATSLAQTGAEIKGMIGSNLILKADSFYAQVAPLEIVEIKTPLVLDVFSPLQFAVIAKNTGNTVASSSGTIQLTGMRGETKDILAIFPDLILGKSTRALRVSNKTENLNLPLEPSFTQNLWPGMYTITVTLTHPHIAQAAASTTKGISLIVFPIRLVLGAIAVIIIFALLRKIFLVFTRKKQTE